MSRRCPDGPEPVPLLSVALWQTEDELAAGTIDRRVTQLACNRSFAPASRVSPAPDQRLQPWTSSDANKEGNSMKMHQCLSALTLIFHPDERNPKMPETENAMPNALSVFRVMRTLLVL